MVASKKFNLTEEFTLESVPVLNSKAMYRSWEKKLKIFSSLRGFWMFVNPEESSEAEETISLTLCTWIIKKVKLRASQLMRMEQIENPRSLLIEIRKVFEGSPEDRKRYIFQVLHFPRFETLDDLFNIFLAAHSESNECEETGVLLLEKHIPREYQRSFRIAKRNLKENELSVEKLIDEMRLLLSNFEVTKSINNVQSNKRKQQTEKTKNKKIQN